MARCPAGARADSSSSNRCRALTSAAAQLPDHNNRCNAHVVDVLEGKRPTVTMTPQQQQPEGPTVQLSTTNKAVVTADTASRVVLRGLVKFDWDMTTPYTCELKVRAEMCARAVMTDVV